VHNNMERITKKEVRDTIPVYYSLNVGHHII
jgi:muramoyltetrapeptide carboxypeptidase LdcA involved in peptidoglycan recycling